MEEEPMELPVVFTLVACPACDALKSSWAEQSIEYEERRVDLRQEWMDEARTYGDVVPIVVYLDGRVEEGFPGVMG